MSVIDLVPAAYWTRLGVDPEEARAYVPGSAVVTPSDERWGLDPGQFSPTTYADYLATSNGVYACCKLRATLLSSLPLLLHKVSSTGKKTDVTSGDLFALLQKVNPWWTFGRLIEMTELSLSLWGAAFWVLDRGGSATRPPREIWWVRPDRMKVVPHRTDYIAGYLYQADNGATEIPFRTEEVIYLRYPNPINEFAGLSPLAAARLAADTASGAMHSNFNLFKQGIQIAGIVSPGTDGRTFSEEQAQALEAGLSRRLSGADKAHRWAVLRYEAKFQGMQMTPKDAEFLGALKWALEDIARAYGIPQDLIGGQRTYENVDAAQRAIWEHTIRPEARFLAAELTEQLLPMFPGQADLAEFDLSGVEALKEAETEKWARWSDQITKGARTVNEFREEEGLTPVAWGDDWWASAALAPVGGPMADEAAAAAEEMADQIAAGQGPDALPMGDEERAVRQLAGAVGMTDSGRAWDTSQWQRATVRILPAGQRTVAYGSGDHQRIMRRVTRRTDAYERAIGERTAALMRNQRKAVLARLKAERGTRDALPAVDDPFDLPRWIKTFREAMRSELTAIVEDAGQAALDDLGLGASFDVSDPNVIRFVERRAQRFAREVNETTWVELKASLSEGMSAGEGIPELADRVEAVMGERIRSSGEVIARTESAGAYTGGSELSWRQSGVVTHKTWLAALDDRTRDTHLSAHGQTVALGEEFQVGDASGPGPGLMNSAEESCNCRCAISAVLDVEMG